MLVRSFAYTPPPSPSRYLLALSGMAPPPLRSCSCVAAGLLRCTALHCTALHDDIPPTPSPPYPIRTPSFPSPLATIYLPSSYSTPLPHCLVYVAPVVPFPTSFFPTQPLSRTLFCSQTIRFSAAIPTNPPFITLPEPLLPRKCYTPPPRPRYPRTPTTSTRSRRISSPSPSTRRRCTTRRLR